MKVNYITMSVKLAIVLLLLAITVLPVSAEAGQTIYFVPHQDDETLYMGADISLQYRLGRQVVIVLVTKGDASGVRDAMCMQKKICLTKAQFIAARNAEMVAAVKRLAPDAVIKYENYPDGALTNAQASSVLKKYLKLYPSASFKTTSWMDNHPDHRTIALALKFECAKGNQLSSSDCRFFQSRDYWVSQPVTGEFVAGQSSEFAAADEYALWNPSIGRYSIGRQSMSESFAAMRNDPRNKFHFAMTGKKKQSGK